jgi:hypothetical protein
LRWLRRCIRQRWRWGWLPGWSRPGCRHRRWCNIHIYRDRYRQASVYFSSVNDVLIVGVGMKILRNREGSIKCTIALHSRFCLIRLISLFQKTCKQSCADLCGVLFGCLMHISSRNRPIIHGKTDLSTFDKVVAVYVDRGSWPGSSRTGNRELCLLCLLWSRR